MANLSPGANLAWQIAAYEAGKKLLYRIFPPHSLPYTLPS
jgi:hypothetical protein